MAQYLPWLAKEVGTQALPLDGFLGGPVTSLPTILHRFGVFSYATPPPNPHTRYEGWP